MFPLESRIFHSISIGLIALSFVYIPYNLYEGLYIGSLSALLIGSFFFYQYYYSRFHGKQHSNTLFGLTGILIFGVNYFSNSGINGSTDLIWPAYLLLVFAISPYRQHVKWLIVYLLCFLNNAMEMLSNLWHWSKSQMEGPSVHLLEVNLLTVLLGTLEMEKVHALKKDISLTYQVSPQLTVIADVDMLQLVVRNLISNAVKFTPQGGQINIEAQLVLDECKIMISDNGNGIPEDKQESIFSIRSEPAFGTNNERGVGLGLVLCKEFIERQSGRIGFESNPGLGSSFFIFVPAS